MILPLIRPFGSKSMHYVRNGTAMETEQSSVEPASHSATPASGSSNRHTKRPHALKILAVLLIVSIVGTVLLALLSRRVSPSRLDGNSTVAKQVVSSLRMKGTTEAVRSQNILSPVLSGQQVGSLTITRLAHAGARVKRGDLLVEFDRQAQVRAFFEKQAEFSKLADRVIQEQANESAARARDETGLRQAENDSKKAELQVQKLEILSRIEAEKAQETLEEAKATLQQSRETFDLKRKAALAAIRIWEIQRDRIRQTMVHSQANAELMQIHSPIEGVVVLNTIWKGEKLAEVQEGDQIRPGQPVMQVVDPSEMQVTVLVNQQDFLALKVGQLGKVRLDAYPEIQLPGKLEQISPIGRVGNFSPKVRTFAVVFSIQGTDERLMPDLSAAVDLDVAGAAATAQGAPR